MMVPLQAAALRSRHGENTLTDNMKTKSMAGALRTSEIKAIPPSTAKASSPASAASHMSNDDALAAWQNKPRMRSRALDTYVNYCVLGESGLGKTTLISNIINNCRVANAARVQDDSTTTLNQFQADPASLRFELEPMFVPECSRRVLISIQDMPGWGDDVNLTRYLRAITTFLLEQRAKDYETLSGKCSLGEAAMCGQLQHSITACLYFIPPHRIKKVDLILMAAVSQIVPIIPVISKADTMTDAELAAYRAELNSMFINPNQCFNQRNMPQLEVSIFQFDKSITDSLAMGDTPLAVTCSRHMEPCDDPEFLASLGLDCVTHHLTQPVRQYKWGAVYPLNRGHSDLIVLKRLLLGDRVESLYAMLDDNYQRYLQFCGNYEENDKQVQLAVQDICCVVSPYLENDNAAKARTALSSAKNVMQALTEENRMLAARLAEVEQVKAELVERLRSGNKQTRVF